MEHPLVVKIDTTGAVKLVYHPDKQAVISDKLAAGLGQIASEQRGAYVFPRNPVLRWLFKAIRRRFGSTGIISELTRSWPCRWVVVLPGEHVRLPGVFQSHFAAVCAEVQWITNKK